MSHTDSELYEFGDFCLDVKERRLVHADSDREATALPEKAFATLVHLIRNHGKLVSKDELMASVWPDTAVEENNVDKAVHFVRRSLGERNGDRKFIETVRGHGFRFVAEVRRLETTVEGAEHGVVSSESKSASMKFLNAGTLDPFDLRRPSAKGDRTEMSDDGLRERRKIPIRRISVAAVVIAFGAVGFGRWYESRRAEVESPILSRPFEVEELSTDGRAFNPAISRDGSILAYTTSSEGGTFSVWFRDLSTGHNRELIEPSSGSYLGLEFSPNGRWLYFVRRDDPNGSRTGLFRISVMGGIPERVADDVQGRFGLSPDGGRVAFIRCRRASDDSCSLFLADASDGSEEQLLLSLPWPEWIRDVDFSPDGEIIAFASGRSVNGATDFKLSALSLQNREVRELSNERFFNITGVNWLKDQTSLLISASRTPNQNYRIWRIDADSGKAEQLTANSDNYYSLSLDQDKSLAVSEKVVENFRVSVLNFETGKEEFALPRSRGASFGSDGKLYVSSVGSGNKEIWEFEADGRGKKQLTNDPADDFRPVAGLKHIYFSSNRDGSWQVWRMNHDGTDPVRLTSANGGLALAASENEDWVYYHHGIDRTLWKVSVTTGEEVSVLSETRNVFAVSRDAARAATPELDGDVTAIAIYSLIDGRLIEKVPVGDPHYFVYELTWLSDDSGIAYFTSPDKDARASRLWVHRFGAGNILKTNIELKETIDAPALSQDGKRIAIPQGGWLHDTMLIRGLR